MVISDVEPCREKTMTTQKKTKYVHEGKYMAGVDVELVVNENEWSPYLTLEDAYKLDDVREALRRGDHKTVAENARIYELHRLAG